MSEISNRVTHTVVLGRQHHRSPLTITSTGTVAPTIAGADALVIPAKYDDATINNQGLLLGAAGAPNGYGGDGISSASSLTLTNAGTIAGGDGAAGGIGIYLTPSFSSDGSTLTNTGVILGGAGIVGPGGIGISAETLYARLHNAGRIEGGTGLGGGVAIVLGGYGRLYNGGSVMGGAGLSGLNAPANGGSGVLIRPERDFGNYVQNSGSITGGVGGSDGVQSGNGGAGLISTGAAGLTNTGIVMGGTGGAVSKSGLDARYGGAGGAGVDLSKGSSSIKNEGTIVGGAGGSTVAETGYLLGGAGGAGLLIGYSGTNDGLITGGAGGGTSRANHGGLGGVGVTLVGDGNPDDQFTNSGTVLGGNGGTSFDNYGYIGNGGDGFVERDAGKVENDGLIRGGRAGNGSPTGSPGGDPYGGFGGAGVVLAAGGRLSNDGTIVGGAGSNGYFGGVGGVGVMAAENTYVANAGIIIGGAGSNASFEVGVIMQAGATLNDTGTIMGGVGKTAGGVGVEISAGTLVADGLIAGGHVGSHQALAIALGGPADLIIDPGAMLVGATYGFTTGDTIDFVNFKASSFSYDNGTLTLNGHGNGEHSILLAGDYTHSDFALKSDEHNGTDVIYTGPGQDFTSLMGGAGEHHGAYPALRIDHSGGVHRNTPAVITLDHITLHFERF